MPQSPYDSVNIRDIVLPVIKVSNTSSGPKYDGLLGTCFRMKGSTVLLTAAHVTDEIDTPHVLCVANEKWAAFPMQLVKKHPTEDLAIFKAPLPEAPPSFLVVDPAWHGSSRDYQGWGYPEDVLYDENIRAPDGSILQNPDLVFTKGYIRRRFTGEIGSNSGKTFYELSESAGAGCSGGPIVTTKQGDDWLVGGIYLADRLIEGGGTAPKVRSYALRLHEHVDFLKQYSVPVGG